MQPPLERRQIAKFMWLFRTIRALAIAASLALLPMGAPAVAGLPMSSGDAQISVEMGGSTDMSMDDCCPDDMKGMPGHSGGDKCGMGVCCVGGTVAIGDIGTVGFRFIRTAATQVAIPADQIVPVRAGSPPHRPPRV